MWEKKWSIIGSKFRKINRVYLASERAKEKKRAWYYERNIMRLERGILKIIEWMRVNESENESFSLLKQSSYVQTQGDKLVEFSCRIFECYKPTTIKSWSI